MDEGLLALAVGVLLGIILGILFIALDTDRYKRWEEERDAKAKARHRSRLIQHT